MKNLVFIGPPGSGKGTQSKILCQELGFTHVSTGDLLRKEIAKKSELGLKIKSVMNAGDLVSDELVVDILKANIDLDNHSYIFDGFPRNVEQARVLDEQILGSSKYVGVFFDVNIDGLIKRIVNRRVTKDGKNIYNILTKPPAVEGICDITGQELIQRNDDKEEVVLKRMTVYKNETSPLLKFYEEKKLLKTVDAEQGISDVTEQIKKILD